jgi:hypothetical protein
LIHVTLTVILMEDQLWLSTSSSPYRHVILDDLDHLYRS